MRLVGFTTLGGRTVFVNPDHVVTITDDSEITMDTGESYVVTDGIEMTVFRLLYGTTIQRHDTQTKAVPS